MSSTTERAFANLANITGQPDAERARIAEANKSIAAAMRGVVADRYNPQVFAPMARVTPVGAVVAKAVGERWIDAQALRTPETASTDATIERMVNAALPHGRGNPEYRGAGAEATLRKAVAAARAAEPEPVAQVAPVSAVAEPVAPEPVAALPAVVARAAGTITRRRLV